MTLVQTRSRWWFLSTVVAVTRGAVASYNRHRTYRMAAALAFYTLFSLFPLLLLFLSLIGYLLDAGWQLAVEVRQYLIRVTISTMPAAGSLVNSALKSIEVARGTSGLIGLFGLLWSASTTFNHMHIALDEIWEFDGRVGLRLTVRRRVAAILTVLGLGFVLVAAQVVKSATYWLAALTDLLPGGPWLHDAVTWLFPFVVAITVFGVMYRTFPSMPISWQGVWPGAVLAGVGWELLKWLFVLYASTFANWQAVYGPVAGVIGLLAWLYLSFTVLLFGAEYSAAYAARLRIPTLDVQIWASDAPQEEMKPPEVEEPSPHPDTEDPAPSRPQRAAGWLSGTAAGVIGIVAALGVGIGLLVSNARRLGKTPAE